jgi:acetamidase/formamidase
MHANQGDGELALHTTDVSGHTTFEVELIEGLDLNGPLLLPNEADLPHISKPYTDQDIERGRDLGTEYGVDVETDMGPIQIVGTGATINDATENAYDRAGHLLGMSEGEIRTRCTFTGGVEVGRLPGVVQLTMLAPMETLDERGLGDLVRAQYSL